ncbi:MAG TPA: DUF3320 domain-containing protein, partial [Pirellulales bacterium]|nr:DUF3320 domain-containing protein [Pirellulales bacterium]
ASELAALLQASQPQSLQEIERLVYVVDALLDAPTITSADLLNQAWNDAELRVDGLLACGKRLKELRAALASRWQTAAEEVDWTAVAAFRRLHGRSMLRWLRPTWHRHARLIRAYLLPSVRPADEQLLDDFETFREIKCLAAELREAQSRGEKLFAALWQGEASDWSRLQNHAAAMNVIRDSVARGETSASALAVLCDEVGREKLRRLRERFASARNELAEKERTLRELLSIDMAAFLGDEPQATRFETWRRRLQQCREAIDGVSDWIDLRRRTRACYAAGLREFSEWCRRNTPFAEPDACSRAFLRQFYRLWLEAMLAEWPEFRRQHGDDLERLIQRFRQADRRWLIASRERLIALADARRPQKGRSSAKTSRLGQLEAEVRRKRGLKPVRKLFSQLGDVVQVLKPCFMMSPMSAAQYLEPGKLSFDLVIFDEASQVEPADALGAIARGRQVILVGDEKQLPPTNFFGVVNDADAEDEPDDASINTGDLESVLAMGRVCLAAKTTLRWHYRSRHSSLIEFSNQAFYDRQLRVFPSPQISREQFGLSFRHVPDGVYFRGKGQYNAVEARAVAEAVIDHARTSPEVSLGVGAFSLSQQRAIEDEIESLRRAESDPELEEFFAPGEQAPFFVKNLETIQGDERDVILLSVGYGPDENGRMSMNFGPLNREGGWRRLNVLVTRARRRCVLFSSLTADQLDLKASTPRGVCALKDYLYFAQHGSLPAIRQHGEDHESLFEADVCRELRSRGWTVHAQVGCAGFSIDLAVVDPQSPGRYLLGIECDGATYQSSATARDRDRLRDEVLRSLGWKLYRTWSADWFERRAETVERLLRRLEEATHGAAESEDDRNRSTEGPDDEEVLAAPDAGGGKAAKGQDDNETAPRIPGMSNYERYVFRSGGTRQQLLRMRNARLIDLLSQVAAVEGPIHRDELCRIVAAAYQARYTGQIKSKLADGVEAGEAAERFECRDEFVWPAGMHQPPVRWRGGENAVTDPRLICPEEIAAAAALVVQHEFGIPLDDLPVSTLRALGFKRVTGQLAELGRTGVQQAIAARMIAGDKSGFMVATNRGG